MMTMTLMVLANDLNANSHPQNWGKEELGQGGNKQVYAYGDDQAVGILKPGKPVGAIDDEIKMLEEARELGLPVVGAVKILVDGKSAILFDRFAQSEVQI